MGSGPLKRVGIVGWRGMVGSVLLDRMREAGDFALISEVVFFSTSQQGQQGPDVGQGAKALEDAHNLDRLEEMDAIVTCQGGDYTKAVFGPLRERGWSGYWIDAASTLRMADPSVIVLDPVNRGVIDRAIEEGKKDFIGGNCTVSLLLLALGGLFAENLVEWVSPHTYQAASGAGARVMQELISQMAVIGEGTQSLMQDPKASILDIDRQVCSIMSQTDFPIAQAGAPLAGSLLPWIDSAVAQGRTREEWKAEVEANKILSRHDSPVHIDGLCVRVGAMRCHSQALTIKLRKSSELSTLTELLAHHNDWVKVVPNTREETLAQLTPAATTGTLTIPVGRIRPLSFGPEYISAFTVGDQLLWGAAEPLRRILRILLQAL